MESGAVLEHIEVAEEFLIVFDVISSFYSNQKFSLAKFSYKLLFNCVCNLYNENFSSVYAFLVFLVNNIGFDISNLYNLKNSRMLNNVDLNFALDVLAEVLNILTNQNSSLNCTISNVTFSDFLKILLSSVMSLTVCPNLHVYRIFHSIIAINPLIIEQIASDILAYLIINRHDLLHEYEKVIVSTFQVFSKLHRVEKLVHLILQAINEELNGTDKKEKVNFIFLGIIDQAENTTVTLPNVESIFSRTVLQAFSNCIINLHSWQFINIFKTFNFHFSKMLEVTSEGKLDLNFVAFILQYCYFHFR